RGDRKVGEALREVRRGLINAIGGAIMEQVPDDLEAGGFGSLDHRQPARPVIFARRFLDEVPAEAIAHGTETELVQLAVIAGDMLVVAGRADEIEAHAVAPAMGRAFEARHEEAVEFGDHQSFQLRDRRFITGSLNGRSASRVPFWMVRPPRPPAPRSTGRPGVPAREAAASRR